MNNPIKPNDGLQKELIGLKEKLWKTPFRLFYLLNIVPTCYLILTWIVQVDLIPFWCDILSTLSFILPPLLAIRIYIESRALKKYLLVLERKRFDEAVSYGREYYSIKRKGFSGLDGQAYTFDDDDEIANDVVAYSSA